MFVIAAYDPEGMEQARPLLPEVTMCDNPYQAIKGADAVAIVTEWDAFRALDLARMKEIARAPVLVDLRNIYQPEDVRAALDSPRPELLALACMAVGIDRSAFPTLLELVRKLNGGKPGAENGSDKASALGSLSPEIAAAAFRQAARPV